MDETKDKYKVGNGYEMDEMGYKVHNTTDTTYNGECEQKDTEPKSWGEVWYEFSQDTTFHGVNKIGAATPFFMRR